jgi:probable HAF family extracellular repeat protein
MVDLGTLGGSSSTAFGINNAGQVVGFSNPSSGPPLAFLWTEAGGMVSLGALGGLVPFSSASDINDLGHVVGQTSTATNDNHAFLWTPAGGMVDLGTLGGTNSSARAINEGQFHKHTTVIFKTPAVCQSYPHLMGFNLCPGFEF